MRDALSWLLVGVGLVVVTAPWTEAKSSSQTVGVQIIMPPRPSAAPTPLEAALQEPLRVPDGVQRTTTVVHEGNAMTVLVTDVPLI